MLRRAISGLAPSRELAQAFAAALEGSGPAGPDGEDGLRAVEIIEACYRSFRSGAAAGRPLEPPRDIKVTL